MTLFVLENPGFDPHFKFAGKGAAQGEPISEEKNVQGKKHGSHWQSGRQCRQSEV